MSFSFTRAADLQAAYGARTTDPVAVAERALAAARGLDALAPPMRTFIALDEADVIAAAQASAQRWRAGQPHGPLDGVPIAVKDEFDVRGYATTAGTRFLGRTKATADALVVARLRAAGAIVFGKTNMHELGVHPSGLNPWHGTARNPYDPARDTGGSSSGSGAAVALGLVPIALGNDGGGSIRIPAALNGVCGHKPTFGRVPTDGVRLLCWSLESSGPLASSVDDLVTAMAVLTDAPLVLPSLPSSKPLRVGICTPWWSWAAGEVQAIARAAVEKLVGGELVEIALPHIPLSLPVGAATFTVEAAAAMARALDDGAPLAPSTRATLELARGLSAVAFVQAQRARQLIVRDFARALADVDVVVTPTTAVTAPRYRDATDELDEAMINRMVAFTFAGNLTGLPATSVPCGYDREGMPVGLQVVAGPGGDELALAVARRVEQVVTRRRVGRVGISGCTGAN